MPLRLFMLALALQACDSVPAPDDPPAAVDADGDGFPEEQDCNDTNSDIYPRAEEACNGLDDDCDDAIDEDFDVDEDGYLSDQYCPAGTDCDDRDAAVNPSQTEVPYDGVDQDCSGADLVDVDGDGFDSIEVGGLDCDDTDAAVNPSATEIPKNGADDDCADGDLLDEDGDGFDDEDYGGTDCDDDAANVYPGALDWRGDGVDKDCDGEDGAGFLLADAPIIFNQPTSMTVAKAFGTAVAICDLDGDGIDDLIANDVAAASFNGRVYVFLGKNYSTWTAGTDTRSADALIEGKGAFGGNVVCGDVDGDGTEDLVVSQAHNNTFGTFFGVAIFYGGPTLWSGRLSLSDGRLFERSVDYPQSLGGGPTHRIDLHDMDQNGTMDVVYLHGPYWDDEATAQLWVLPGTRYTSDGAWVDSPGTPWDLDIGDRTYTWAQTCPDLDGDGHDELFIAAALADTPTKDAGNTMWLQPAGATSYLSALRTRFHGATGDLLAERATAADLDGDGDPELILASPRADIPSAKDAGRLTFYDDPSALSTTDSIDDSTAADAFVTGSLEEEWLGSGLQAVGDIDGDGCDDILVWDPQQTPRTYRPGPVRLLSGCRITWTGEEDLETLTLATWIVEEDFAAWIGNALAVGDFDGDGRPDLVIGDSGMNSIGGRVYVYPSATMGW